MSSTPESPKIVACREVKPAMLEVLEAEVEKKLEEASLEELRYLKVKFEGKKDVANTNQLSVKVVMNASYGGLGTKKGRFSGFKEIAMTITWRGRWAIQVTRDFVLNYTSQAHVKADPRWDDVKLDVIYGDTDSVFVKMTNTRNKLMTIADAWYYAKAVSKEATKSSIESRTCWKTSTSLDGLPFSASTTRRWAVK